MVAKKKKPSKVTNNGLIVDLDKDGRLHVLNTMTDKGLDKNHPMGTQRTKHPIKKMRPVLKRKVMDEPKATPMENAAAVRRAMRKRKKK